MHFLFPVQNKPLPAETAVFILQKEVCRENSGDKTQSRRWENMFSFYCRRTNVSTYTWFLMGCISTVSPQLWPRLPKRFYTVETWSSCWRWCWPLGTSWTKARGGTLTALKCLHSTRSPIPNPASTSTDVTQSSNVQVWRKMQMRGCLLLVASCRNITLLHYLITILEKKYSKVLMFQEDLKTIPEAAKVKSVTSTRSCFTYRLLIQS